MRLKLFKTSDKTSDFSIFAFFAKIILTFSPLLLTSFFLSDYKSPRSDIEMIVLLLSAFLSLALFVRFDKDKRHSYFNFFIFCIFSIISLFYFIKSDKILHEIVFKIDSNIWNNLYSTWSIMLIFSVYIFFIAIQEFGVYKKIFNFVLFIQFVLFIINLFYFYLDKEILNYGERLLRLQIQLFYNSTFWSLSLVIIFVTTVSYFIKVYLENKKHTFAVMNNKHIKYFYFFMSLIYFYIFFVQVLQYFLFNKLNQVLNNPNMYNYVYSGDALKDIENIRKYYSNDTILLAENKIVDVERRSLLEQLTYPDKIKVENPNTLVKSYADNINRQIRNAKDSIYFNPSNYLNHLELGLAYEKASLLINKTGDAYDRSMERYQIAQSLKEKDKDEISVMMARLELSRRDKSQEEREAGFLYYIKEAFTINPYSKIALKDLIFFQKIKSPRDALNNLDLLVKVYTNDKEMIKFAIMAYYELGDYANTLHHSLGYLSSKDREDKAVAFYLFKALYFNNNLQEAKNIFNGFLKENLKLFSDKDQAEINDILSKIKI